MRVEVEAGSPESVDADVLAAPLLAAEPANAPVAALNERLGGLIAKLVDEGELSGKLKTAPILHVDGELNAARLAIAGIGARAGVDADAVRTAAATVARETREYASTVAWLLDDSLPLSPPEQARAIVDGTILGSYDPGGWKSDEETPRLERLAQRAAEVANTSPELSAEALGLEEIRELGMGALAGVAQGSHNPAQVIVMRYEPAEPRTDIVLGLVGKAVTFDTGGISIKKALYMEDMKGDMAGGGAVIATLGALAELGCPLRVIGVVGATENADGRLVLADALPYARQLGATHLVDLATLTGAMERALGDFYAGVFANDAEWRTLVVES